MSKSGWARQPVSQKVGWLSRVFVVNDFAEHLSTLVKDLESSLQNTGAALKHDRTTTVIKLELPSGSFVLKRYNPRNQWHKIKRALRRTRALRCWRMSYAFQRAGLHVARPVMMVEKRFGPIRLNAYFVNELLQGDELLEVLPKMPVEEQRKVMKAVQRAFMKMRTARITHGDLKASNLLWVDEKLFFIDLDAAVKHRNTITWSKSHAKDRKRFTKNWVEYPELLELFNQECRP